MTRLKQGYIDYAVGQAKRGRGGKAHESPGQMAARWGVTARRVRQVQQLWRETGLVPQLNPHRRPKAPDLTPQEKAHIEAARHETQRGARKLWLFLRRNGIRIPKHKIHAYATQQKWSTPNPKKQKQRSYRSYARDHTGSLVHGDWHRTSEAHPYFIAWIDDASRRMLSAGEFDALSGERSIATFQEAQATAAHWGVRIREVNTDQGSEFYSSPKRDWEPGKSEFTKYLESQGIRHIPSRPRHPQTNGKAERVWLEYDRHRWRFPTLQDWVDWYNRQIHDELWTSHEWGIYENPDEAFQRKLPPEVLIQLHHRFFENEPAALTVEVIYGK